jgi:C4-dicarboxylate transporter DctQ subunit
MPVFRLYNWLIRAGAGLASALFVFAGIMLTYEVVARYFFTKPTSWAAELSQMCLIWGSLLAMAYLLSKRQHIQVDAVVQLLPAYLVRCVDVVVLVVVGVFAAVVTWYGFEIFYDSFTRGRTTGSLLNIPIWIVELAVPVGFFLLTTQCLYEIKRIVSADSESDTSTASPPQKGTV